VIEHFPLFHSHPINKSLSISIYVIYAVANLS
jgi:hypothetical protein